MLTINFKIKINHYFVSYWLKKYIIAIIVIFYDTKIFLLKNILNFFGSLIFLVIKSHNNTNKYILYSTLIYTYWILLFMIKNILWSFYSFGLSSPYCLYQIYFNAYYKKRNILIFIWNLILPFPKQVWFITQEIWGWTNTFVE